MTQFKEMRPAQKETVVRTQCNWCGNDVDEDQSTLHAAVHGGYGSPTLLDCTSYEFDLCEFCIVKLMDGFGVPPTLGGSHGYGTTYVEDRAVRANMTAEKAKRDLAWAEAIAAGTCPWREDQPHSQEMGSVDDTPMCARCMIGWYTRPEKVMTIGGRTWSFADRLAIGLDMIERVRQRVLTGYLSEFERSLRIDTAVSMLGESPDMAIHALLSLTKEHPKRQPKWIGHRVPLLFPPDEAYRVQDLALNINDWLGWAQENGYREAAACVLLGKTANEHWHYYLPDPPTEAP